MIGILNRAVLCAGAACALCAPRSPAASQAPEPLPTNNFAKLFANPTGQNGYEEMVRAGDILANAPVWRDYNNTIGSDQPATLQVKRRLVSDPLVRSALDTLRAGLKKPVRSPRASLDDEIIFPELMTFRPLARVLGVSMYVDMADGRVPQALDNLADVLKLGYAAQTDSLVSGLVGISVDTIAIRQLSEHLDQLSMRDCDRLLALVRAWLDLPDPAIPLIRFEKASMAFVWNKYKADPVKLLTLIKPQKDDPPLRKQQFENVRQELTANPNSAAALFDQARLMNTARFDQVIDSLNQPAWNRKPPTPIDQTTMAGVLAELMAGDRMLGTVLDRYSQEQAQIQMLGVHALIRHYLWEYGSLPGGLADLKLGKLALDPFNGQPFEFKRLEGTRYSLASIGPIDRNPAPGTIAGQRIPIQIPPKP